MTKARDLSVGIPNGLVLIKPTGATNGTVNDSGTVTIGSVVSSVTVSGAFSTTYDNYKIVVAGGVGSSASHVALGLKLGASATGYYAVAANLVYSNASTQYVFNNNTASWTQASAVTSSGFGAEITLFNPFLAIRTVYTSQVIPMATDAAAGPSNGYHTAATSYTDFTLTPASGTLTGGTISIYGYRK